MKLLEKNYRLQGIMLLMVLVIALFASAEAVHPQQSRREGIREKLEERKKFREEREEDFAEFLQERWEKMEEIKNAPVYSEPKLSKQPVRKEQEDGPTRSKQFNYEEVEAASDEEPEVETEKPDPEPDKPAAKPESKEGLPPVEQMFTWYGAYVEIPENVSLPGGDNYEVEESEAAEFYSNYDAGDFSNLKEFLKTYRQELKLAGWHELYFIYSAVDKIASDQQGGRRRTKILSTWAFAQDLGYDVRLGMDEEQYYLLYYSPRSIPGTSYFTLDKKDYYIFLPEKLGKPDSSIRTYNESFPGTTQAVIPYVSRLPELPWVNATRQVAFSFEGQDYEFELEYNESLSDYYQSVPQVKPQYYFNPIKTPGIKDEFLEQVNSEIQDMDTWTAMDFLLRLTQEGFDYKTDQKQFGRQWFMIPPDKSAHPYSDCDDRSIFYGWLVRNLLGLEVAAVRWPGHLSTAVNYPENDQPDGAYVTVDGKKYVLNDPTYIGAGPGEVMNRYQNESPRLLFP